MTHGDQSWSSIASVNWRQASPLTRRDQCGHLRIFIEDSTSIDRDYHNPFLLPSRDNRVRWRVKTVMVTHSLLSRDNRVRYHAETPHGYLHLRHLETTSPMTREDQSWPFATFVNQRQVSPLIKTTLVSPSSSRDSKSDDTRRQCMVIRTLPIQRLSKSSLSSRDRKVR